MTYIRNLPTPYHQQDTDYYCGAACAQMVLEYCGAGVIDQATLYTTYNHQNTRDPGVNWATSPEGLDRTLDSWAPGKYHNYFALDAMLSEDAISRIIAWTIEHYEVGPCALVHGWDHWIVVRGMEVSSKPTSYNDTSYTITNFRVNDPWPPVPSFYNPGVAPPPPHAGGDGCGSGGTRGISNQMISYTQWHGLYMTGVPSGYWAGKFVAVCDPRPMSELRGPSLAREQLFDGARIISAADVHRVGMDWVANRVRMEDPEWSTVLQPVKPAAPILVERLDRPEEYYYIVPLVSVGEGATAALLIDARFGGFLQAVAFPTPEVSLLRIPDREFVVKHVIGQRFELERFQGQLLVREETAAIAPHWCWKPCRESLSPFWPFKRVVSGPHTLYIRIDGRVFTALHDDWHGL
jgi:hypothetical protein